MDTKIVTPIIGRTINKTKFVVEEDEEEDDEHSDCNFERLYTPEIFFFDYLFKKLKLDIYLHNIQFHYNHKHL